jgi:hypothetical protein
MLHRAVWYILDVCLCLWICGTYTCQILTLHIPELQPSSHSPTQGNEIPSERKGIHKIRVNNVFSIPSFEDIFPLLVSLKFATWETDQVFLHKAPTPCWLYRCHTVGSEWGGKTCGRDIWSYRRVNERRVNETGKEKLTSLSKRCSGNTTDRERSMLYTLTGPFSARHCFKANWIGSVTKLPTYTVVVFIFKWGGGILLSCKVAIYQENKF